LLNYGPVAVTKSDNSKVKFCPSSDSEIPIGESPMVSISISDFGISLPFVIISFKHIHYYFFKINKKMNNSS
jgi:hypothetical protein